ncbi:tRNA(Ile2) 2-agmatinylcytidine synthetase [Halorientalis persicus]|uniref:tRNA(Ile2) 2-agmatinylcytidine synthetase TiaS n=1 Tax=Halorientalis persicus TaxID=1367881 RepID=A0A1H8I2R4_9EURY|nr:tRNA(Ile)(2)-agmatinylcytidine synthase [Halorientalis persicus]SEN62366.1 tRNA(Ile2) 2-agmatinylcytidine synthetase [Halorientalis persicus]
MTIVGLDDTDSRTQGMCTTYAAAVLAERVRRAGGNVERLLLIRLNPAVEYKTRGNAALAVHCDLGVDEAFELATTLVDETAETADDRTNPGVVVTEDDLGAKSDWLRTLPRRAIQEVLDPETDVRDPLDAGGYRYRGWGNGRGLVGASAAAGAWAGLSDRGPVAQPADWTYECLTYRERERWGSERDVDPESVFSVAEEFYPDIWDTVDRGEGEAVCVPNTPGPVLYGIRGDDRESVEAAAEAIESEPVARRATFVTNQGTDQHLRSVEPDSIAEDQAVRVTGEVVEGPETWEGGHVFFTLGFPDAAVDTLRCAAFEPTKRFRDRVRALRVGDRLTVCGEVSEGTCKLEKFAVRDLNTTALVTPDCPECGRSMKSAGANAGYRCRDCGTSADGKVEQSIARDLERGWYEVPPCARRHIAKPLVRGGFDGETHPER